MSLFTNRKIVSLLVALFVSSVSYARVSHIQYPSDSLSSSVMGKIGEHPRLFFNAAMLPDVKARARHEEKELLDSIRDRIDKLMVSGITFRNKNAGDGSRNRNHQYGFRAAESALLYHVTGEEKYLQFTKKLLKEITDYYHYRNKAKLNIHWYIYSRVSALCAYDWIYPFLSEQERKALGGSLFDALSNMLPEYIGKLPPRSNPGRYESGFYGLVGLRWYMGLVFYKAGIDDQKAEKLLRRGYADHIKMLKHRADLADDDGGAATATLEYVMRAYPWSEFNFFHTFRSATGINIAKEWPHVPLSLNYFFWNWWPGDHHAGYGDANHFTNKVDLDQLHAHLSQIFYFYGDDPQEEWLSLAYWMQSKVKRQDTDVYPFIRFFLKEPPVTKSQKINVDRLPLGRFFPKMGQVLMRSGSRPEDTYAMFSAGGDIKVHRHYDSNNFVIYKKGFRALDTGTRPQPGLHLSHYYSRTIAHNCILIHMPGEIMPEYWGSKAPSEEDLPVPNDGGQSDLLGAEVIAFDENKDYVYIASDATEAYHKDKSALVLRQFLFVAPDIFVVFDKIVSTKPEYNKTWLLHTASEPQLRGTQEFAEASDEGKLFCRTIFPDKVDIQKIGGAGKQFWSGGRNWPLPDSSQNTIPLLGQWRMEISPAQTAAKTDFLHILQVGDLALQNMVETTPIKKEGMKGVKFIYDAKQYEIVFLDGKEHGGQISISKNGKIIRQENFSQKVKPQSGLYGE